MPGNPNPSPATRFKPGNKANAAGMKPGTLSVSARLKALLEKGEINGQKIKDGKQVADLLTEVIVKQALKGDYRFAEMILNRTEGKVPEPVPLKSVASDGKALSEFLGIGTAAAAEEDG